MTKSWQWWRRRWPGRGGRFGAEQIPGGRDSPVARPRRDDRRNGRSCAGQPGISPRTTPTAPRLRVSRPLPRRTRARANCGRSAWDPCHPRGVAIFEPDSTTSAGVETDRPATRAAAGRTDRPRRGRSPVPRSQDTALRGRGSVDNRTTDTAPEKTQVTATQGLSRLPRSHVRCTSVQRTLHAKLPPKNVFPQVRTILPGEARWGGWDSNPKGRRTSPAETAQGRTFTSC